MFLHFIVFMLLLCCWFFTLSMSQQLDFPVWKDKINSEVWSLKNLIAWNRTMSVCLSKINSELNWNMLEINVVVHAGIVEFQGPIYKG